MREHQDIEVVIEPGTSLVQNAAYLVTTVVDLYPSDGLMIAVLDTTMGHMPEVYTYGFSPPVMGASPVPSDSTDNLDHTYLLAGASCLAGDVFGTYAFDKPIEIGSQIVIEKMGAYTHSQWHWYNGINLPTIYTNSAETGLQMAESFSFPDFAHHCAMS